MSAGCQQWWKKVTLRYQSSEHRRAYLALQFRVSRSIEVQPPCVPAWRMRSCRPRQSLTVCNCQLAWSRRRSPDAHISSDLGKHDYIWEHEIIFGFLLAALATNQFHHVFRLHPRISHRYFTAGSGGEGRSGVAHERLNDRKKSARSPGQQTTRRASTKVRPR